jgi:hypothetical protein
VVTHTIVIGIASDTTMTIDIIAGDTIATGEATATATILVGRAGAYKMASVSHIVATEIRYPSRGRRIGDPSFIFQFQPKSFHVISVRLIQPVEVDVLQNETT